MYGFAILECSLLTSNGLLVTPNILAKAAAVANKKGNDDRSNPVRTGVRWKVAYCKGHALRCICASPHFTFDDFTLEWRSQC